MLHHTQNSDLILVTFLLQLPLEVVDQYPPPRRPGPSALSPDSHVVAVDEEDVDLDTRGEC